MNTSANTVMGMNQRHLLNDPSRRTKGLVIVIALHLVMGYALVSGMARTGLNLITKPLEAVVIQEVIIPPPPPPPPPPPQKKIETPKEVVKSEAPPLPFVPPPDVAPPTASPAISIAATTNVPPSPVVITPPPAPAPVPAPALAKPAPNRSDISVACPTQVAPVMPRKAILDGAEGVIKAQIRIKTGVIQEVVILSGPRVFHAAVKTAMLQYKCISDAGGEVVATQEFNFKLE